MDRGVALPVLSLLRALRTVQSHTCCITFCSDKYKHLAMVPAPGKPGATLLLSSKGSIQGCSLVIKLYANQAHQREDKLGLLSLVSQGPWKKPPTGTLPKSLALVLEETREPESDSSPFEQQRT